MISQLRMRTTDKGLKLIGAVGSAKEFIKWITLAIGVNCRLTITQEMTSLKSLYRSKLSQLTSILPENSLKNRSKQPNRHQVIHLDKHQDRNQDRHLDRRQDRRQVRCQDRDQDIHQDRRQGHLIAKEAKLQHSLSKSQIRKNREREQKTYGLRIVSTKSIIPASLSQVRQILMIINNLEQTSHLKKKSLLTRANGAAKPALTLTRWKIGLT